MSRDGLEGRGRRAGRGARARAGLACLAAFTLVMTALVVYTFAAALH